MKPANTNTNDTDRRRVGYDDAAAFLGVKVTTLRSMVHRKQVPHIRLGPSLVRFDLDELANWLKQCSVPATVPA